MKAKKTTLNTGLRVLTVPVASMESATVTIWVGVGSRFETDKISGLSHFLEHMVFKGSKKRPTAKMIAESIDSFGGEFNASTSKEWTNFYIKAPSKRLETAIDVLSDMVLSPVLRETDIKREKGVIVEEIAMYDDTPMAKIGDIFERVIFEGNPLARDIIGTKETVTDMKRSDFMTYRKDHYSSQNIVVTVSGGFDEKKTIKLFEKYFSGIHKKEPPKAETFSQIQKKPKVLASYKKNEQAHFIMGFLGYPMGNKYRFAEAILASILGGGMSSRMFTEVREKRGLAYAVKTSSDHMRDTGYLSTYAGVDLNRVDEAVKVVHEQYMGIIHGKLKIKNDEMVRAKEYVKGHLALSLEDTKDINTFFGIRELLLGKTETPEQVYKNIDNVTLDEVNRVAKELFVPEKLNFAIIGPFKDKGRFEKILG